MDKVLRNVIIGVLCVMAFSVFYYFVLFLPGQKKLEREDAVRKEQAGAMKRTSEEIAKRARYDTCLERARLNYTTNWDRECSRLGRLSDCALPGGLAKSHDDYLKHRQELCAIELK